MKNIEGAHFSYFNHGPYYFLNKTNDHKTCTSGGFGESGGSAIFERSIFKAKKFGFFYSQNSYS